MTTSATQIEIWTPGVSQLFFFLAKKILPRPLVWDWWFKRHGHQSPDEVVEMPRDVPWWFSSVNLARPAVLVICVAITVTRWSPVKNVEPPSGSWFLCDSYMLLSSWTITSKTVFMPLSSPDWQEFGCRAPQKGTSLPTAPWKHRGCWSLLWRCGASSQQKTLTASLLNKKSCSCQSEQHLPNVKPLFSHCQSSYHSKDL